MSINPLQGKVSDFADPSTLQGKVGVAAVGALSSRVVQHLLKNLRDQTTLSVGRIFHAIFPRSATNGLLRAADLLITPLTRANDLKRRFIMYLADNPTISDRTTEQASRVADFVFRVLLAPVGEEIAFRAGVQIAGAKALEMAGVPPIIAKPTAALVANTLFGLAHTGGRDPFDSEAFNNAFSAGLVMALLCDKYGLPTTMIAHVMHNFSSRS